MVAIWGPSGFIVQLGFLNIHVFEFTGFENLPALQAFDKFRIFIAGNDLYTRVLTLTHLSSLLGGCDGRLRFIKPDISRWIASLALA
jgi:hypothetical protein